MRPLLKVLLGLSAWLAASAVLAENPAVRIPRPLLNDSHDIGSLPAWGPYSKQYAGISHLEELDRGMRVDFTVVPGFYRRSYLIPNVLFESGYHPWRADPALRHITYRYELEWKDSLYADVTYHRVDSLRTLVEIRYVNRTDATQNVLLHNLVSLNYDDACPVVSLSDTAGLTLLHGCDYADYRPAVIRHDHALVYDGWLRGEARDRRYLNGSALKGFGTNRGDRLLYRLTGGNGSSGDGFALRYAVAADDTARLRLGGARSGEIELTGRGSLTLKRFESLTAHGDSLLTVESLTETPITLDALILGPNERIAALQVGQKPRNYNHATTRLDHGVMVAYDERQNRYGIACNFPATDVKEYWNSDLDIFMRRTLHRHPPKSFYGDRQGCYTSLFLRPILLAPHSDTTLYTLLATGSEQAVRRAVEEFPDQLPALVEAIRSESAAPRNNLLPQAADYALGEQLLEATLLTNIVYPVYTERRFIRHFTPGKNWNSLYTWDLGFISMALNKLDPVKGFETLRAYTTGADSQSAFIHHGTPLPIQIFAFSELVGELDDTTAQFLYPRLKRYYDFMAGHHPYSTTRMASGLLRTWDYFYSSGGWDDYPPQHALRADTELRRRTAPMVSSAYYLRAAKILRMQALKMGLREDVARYEQDIRRLTDAIRKLAWDPESGYFGYVVHNANGEPEGLYRHADGSNYNMGLDGITPLVAGICTREQLQRICSHLFDPARLWTPVGISTVDRSAPYYDPTGYWNGSVWMPHQYLIWKSMLDNNLIDEAHRIAFTALETWNRECRTSYNCCEHFIIASGRGAGWHNFSGLSSPLINWFHSYFRIGHTATGFDTVLTDGLFTGNCTRYAARVRFDADAAGRTVAILVCMNPRQQYEARINGRKAAVRSPYPGLLYISFEASKQDARLEITAR